MGNSLNIDLEGKYVLLRGKGSEVFKVDGGFGTSPATSGTALFVKRLKDNKEFRSNGYDVKRLATKEEIVLGNI